MNLSKYTLAAALGMGGVGAASAQTVYVTGSTALQSQFVSAVQTPGVVFSAVPLETTWTPNGSTYMAFTGTGTAAVNGGFPLMILCSWSESEAGIQDVTSWNVTEQFPNGPYPGGAQAGAATTFSHSVDLAMADNDTTCSRAFAVSQPTPNPITHKAKVGVVAFKWVRNPGLWTGTNVAGPAIRQALNCGVYRSVFSGNCGDTNDYVYVAGCDNSSGTRVNAFGIINYGIFTVPGQIEIAAGNMVNVGGLYCGDFGQSGGGALAASMTASTVSSMDRINGGVGFSAIAYLGASDAQTAIQGGAVECSYNGVRFSPCAIEQGAYTFWGNEYLMENNDVIFPVATQVFAALSAPTGINSQIATPPASNVTAIRLSDMQCFRYGPTSDPAHY
jgi:hypothetical protein